MLQYKIELFIGFNDQHTYKQEYSTDTMKNTTIDVLLSNKYSNATIERTLGAYKHFNGEIVKEQGCKVTIIQNDKDVTQLLNCIEELKEALNQEAILYTIDTIECYLV